MRIMNLVNLMRQRPQNFFKEEKIEYIFYFICGYCKGCYKDSEDDMDKMFYSWFGKWLILWIPDNFDSEYVPKTVYWYNDIKVIADQKGQEESTVFYELCDLFFDDYLNKKNYFAKRISSKIKW